MAGFIDAGDSELNLRSDRPGKSLLHAHVQREELRGQLPEEFLFGFDRRQSVDLLSFLIRVGEDL